MQLTTRNATLEDLAVLLQDQHARKLDVVASASAIRASGANLVIEGTEPTLTPEGVSTSDGTYVPTAVADQGLADKLGIPAPYLARLRESRPDLYDVNVNGWLHGSPDTGPDPRKFLVRCFRGDEGTGVARAVLSDSYRIVDNLDVLTAALEGIREAGVEVNIDGCDLTDRKMYVRISAPQVQALAPVLLDGYRNPFADPDIERARNHGWDLDRARQAARAEGQDYGADGEPVVFAGFVLSNSEVGGGAFTIVPRLIVRVCKNGLTITRDALRHVHLGSKLDAGVIRWSEDTQAKNLALVTAQARDSVATFLDADYVTTVLERLEAQAGKRLSEPAKVIETVGKTLRFPAERTAGILDHFIRGGQTTAGGVLNAITSYAQTIPDADVAHELEVQGVRALELAATA